MPTPPPESQPVHSVNDYVALVGLIKDVVREAVQPVRDDIKELRDASYTRSELDLMFKLRDEQIARLMGIGSVVACFLGAMWALLASLQIMHVIP